MIIFTGVAGSGKSSQGKMLADQLALPWLSTGEFLRMLVAGDHRRDMISGKLLEDAEIIGLVQKIFNVVDTDEDFVLDGFPRTASQTDWLLNQVKHEQLSITAVINLVASNDVVLERLLKRGRPDDTEEAIAERFAEYEASMKPILDLFKAAGVPVYDVNGEGEAASINQEILSKLKK